MVLNGHFPRWWIFFLAEQTNEKEKLVPIDQVAYRKEWNKTWSELSLEMAPLTLYDIPGPRERSWKELWIWKP